MTHLEYENICSDVSAGNKHKVMNEKSRTRGRVLSCHSDYLNVAVGKGWQVWSREVCRDLEPGPRG